MNFFSHTSERRTAADTAARIVSNLLNPLFLPPLVLLLIGKIMFISTEELVWMVLLAVLFYTIIPLFFTLYFLKTGQITSLDLPERGSRNLLFIYALTSALIVSAVLGIYFYFYHPFLAMIAIVFFLNPLIGYILNFRWKISMHSASIASAGTIFFTLFLLSSQFYISTAGIFSLIFLLILLPVVMWARYQLEVHSLPEIIGGASAGIMVTLLELGLLIHFW